MVVRRKKILYRWINTISQKSNFFHRWSILSVKLLKFLTDGSIDTFSVPWPIVSIDTIGIDPSIIWLKLSCPFSVLAIFTLFTIVFQKKLGVFLSPWQKMTKIGRIFLNFSFDRLIGTRDSVCTDGLMAIYQRRLLWSIVDTINQN